MNKGVFGEGYEVAVVLNSTVEQGKMNEISPSNREEMRAIPYGSGVSFCVWAPHANRAFVTGDFNNWSQTVHPLTCEYDG